VVLVDQTVTYLEMTSPDQLFAGTVPPADVTLDSADASATALIRATHDRIAAPHHWSSLQWSDHQWRDLLSHPDIRSWLARVDGDVIGLIQLQIHPRGDVEITKFGLVPGFVGRGFGGHLLTVATRLAWDLSAGTRVWLHTSSLDHPHALSNYRNRGFRPFRVEHRPREIPGKSSSPTSCGGRCDESAGRTSP
jgi:GNAT superfamily N-acetyltransferase